MAIMEYAVVTESGLAVQAKLAAGNTMVFTKFVAGAGTVQPVLLQKQTEVADPKQEFLFSDNPYYSSDFPGEVIISLVMSNEKVTEEYKCAQVGIYAEDPDDGEILYAVLQTENPFKVPTATENSGWSTEFELTMSYGGAENVHVYVNAAGMLSRQVADKRYMKKLLYDGKLYEFRKDENGVYLAEMEEEAGDTTEVSSLTEADMQILKELFIDNDEFEEKSAGFVPRDGSAPMTGDLKIMDGYAKFGANNSLAVINTYVDNEQGGSGPYRSLQLHNEFSKPNREEALLLTDDSGEVWRIYGEHNPPAALVAGDLHTITKTVLVKTDGTTLNTPYKAGKTNATSGSCWVSCAGELYRTLFYVSSGLNETFIQTCSNGAWSEWGKVDSGGAKITASQTDITAGTTELPDGAVYVVYE